MGKFIMMVEVVRDNFICFDPLNSTHKKFKDREKKSEEVLEMITSRFESQRYAIHKHFNNDLPVQLEEMLKEQIVD